MSDNSQQKPETIIERREFRKRYKEFTKNNFQLLSRLLDLNRERVGSFGTVIERNAEQFIDKVAIKFEGKQLTYKEFNELVNKYAHYFLSLGLKKGDIVDILMGNRIENVVLVGAVAKIGAVGSLINSDLREKSLTHCIKITLGKVIVVGEECFEAFDSIKDNLGLDDQILLFSPDSSTMSCPDGYIDLSLAVEKFPITNPSPVADIDMFDNHLFIFTSGTTGLPKAAYFPRQRLVVAGLYMGKILGQFNEEDTVYVATPLFHSNTLAIGIGGTFAAGATLALARKFSVSRFWDEIRKYNATTFNYVGELLRYLLNQPPKPNDADNPVKKIVGNGLRPEIWMEFKNRFGIERIGEFYGATEGFGMAVNVLNFDCTCGYCQTAYSIVKYDVEEDAPIRGEDGFMQRVKLGDPGLLLFPRQSDISFFGYKDKKATDSKIFRNVFKEGDAWLNTGDLMRDQGCSHMAFVDRVGDTFRWKGHNMSTTEVEKIFNSFVHVQLSTVYGVQIPGTDGRAPMAAFAANVDADKIDFKGLAQQLTNNLPPYGVPVFLRLKTKLPTTSTHKFKKSPLKKEGFDINLIDEALYVKVPHEANYVPLTKNLYEDILKGKYIF